MTDQSQISRRNMFIGAAALPVAALVPSMVNAGEDEELLRLEAEFEAAWAQERAISRSTFTDDDVNTAVDVTGAIVDRICEIPATTQRGLLIKARAVLWCGDFSPTERLKFSDCDCTNERLMKSIVNDLIAL